MYRKWIALPIVLTLALVFAGCPKKKPAPPVQNEPADLTTSTPTQTVPASPTPATAADTTEQQPELSLQELQSKLESMGLLGDVFYEFDKYDLLPESRERLARNAEYMKGAEGGSLTFTIEGHCDERGTNEYNIALGQRRTIAALDYLASLGVDRGRFKTISYGEERPFCTDSNEGCWQKNRRARFVITGRY